MDIKRCDIDRHPISADGIPLHLGMKVWIVKSLAKLDDPGYGRGRSLMGDAEIEEVTVVGIHCLGEPNRRATFLQSGSSITISADLRGVYVNRDRAEMMISPRRTVPPPPPPPPNMIITEGQASVTYRKETS